MTDIRLLNVIKAARKLLVKVEEKSVNQTDYKRLDILITYASIQYTRKLRDGYPVFFGEQIPRYRNEGPYQLSAEYDYHWPMQLPRSAERSFMAGHYDRFVKALIATLIDEAPADLETLMFELETAE